MHRLRGLPAQFTLFTLLPLLLLLMISIVGGVRIHQQETRRLVSARDERAVRAAAAGLSERIFVLVAGLRSLADRAADGTPPDRIFGDSTYLLNTFDGGVAFYDRSRQLMGAVPSAEAWAQRPFVGSLLPAVRDSQSPVFSPLLADVPTRGYVMMIAIPSAQQDVVAIGAFSPQALGIPDLIGGLQVSPRAAAFLVDANSQIIYHTDPARIGQDGSQQPGVSQALQGLSGAFYYTSPPGAEEYAAAFSGVSPVNWGLVIAEPWGDVVSPLLRYSEALQYVFLPAALLAGLALFIGVRRIVRPLQQLTDQAARLGEGDFEAIRQPVGGIAEIQELQFTLADMADEIRSYQAGMRSYLAAITHGQEDERKRLARELHDETVQQLIALDHKVQMAQKAMGRDPELGTARLSELREMVSVVVEDVRRFSRNLRPIYLEDLGLLPALEMLTRDADKDGSLRVSFNVDGQPQRLSQEREMAIYRIAQEALNNVAAHAHASTVQVSVCFDSGEMSLSVADNGQGFDVPERIGELAKAGHYGLLGMSERAELVGGVLEVRSQPGAGTTIQIRLPVLTPDAAGRDRAK